MLNYMKTVTLTFQDDQDYQDTLDAFEKSYGGSDEMSQEEIYLTQMGRFSQSVTKVYQVNKRVGIEKTRIEAETNYSMDISTDTTAVSVTTEPTNEQVD